MSDVTDRLDALEKAVAANALPSTIAVLQRTLEQHWQPDASVLLQAGSITDDMLSSRAVGGMVDGAGTFPLTINGATVTRTALGHYTVTFATPFSTAPTVVVGAGSDASAGGYHAGINYAAKPTATSFGAQVTDATSAAYKDSLWSFLAWGPR